MSQNSHQHLGTRGIVNHVWTYWLTAMSCQGNISEMLPGSSMSLVTKVLSAALYIENIFWAYLIKKYLKKVTYCRFMLLDCQGHYIIVNVSEIWIMWQNTIAWKDGGLIDSIQVWLFILAFLILDFVVLIWSIPFQQPYFLTWQEFLRSDFGAKCLLKWKQFKKLQ